MRFSELHQHLDQLEKVEFALPDGRRVPKHFHVTEVGFIQKSFIDCGGTMRKEDRINLQLWSSFDYHHRLAGAKFRDILDLSKEKLGLPDAEIEVEYQGQTIEKYGLSFKDGLFQLEGQQTDCLAKDNCGLPDAKVKRALSSLSPSASCSPSSNCC